MARPCRLSALSALSALFLGLGCAGPPIPAPIDGIPVCPDFTTGNARMEGGLRFPVRLRVLEGKTVLFKTVIPGLRHADAPTPKTFIIDDNAKYTVEWAQCGNPHAPRRASEAVHTGHAREVAREVAREGEGAAYECGEVNVYKGDGVLETRKGDRASHTIKFAPPPNLECWAGNPGTAPTVRDAGADAAANPDAGAAPTQGDAGAAPTQGDAGAAPSQGDAGAAMDAGKPK